MMKFYRFTLMLAALLTAVAALASAPSNYYNSAIGKNDEGLMISLRNIIRDHRQLSYNALWDAFKTTDTDKDGYIIDMYSNCRYRPDQHGGSSSSVGGGFNREHSFPKSWFNDGYPMYTDLFHLYPTDIRVNNQRSNYPFGVCAKGTRLTNGAYVGKGKLGTSTYPGYSGTVFEPDDEYKGDFARTYFYMVTCYKNELPSWPGSAQLNYSANSYKAFSTWSINMLMEWTRMDPVSEKEIKRNDAVYSIQGNRNPFIDYPELAEYIWGNMQGKGWAGPGGGTTPSAAITSPANGSTINMGSTIVGTALNYTINLKGQELSKSLSLTMSDHSHFTVSKTSFTSDEVNNGTMFDISFDGATEGSFDNTITISSDEVSTTFTVNAIAIKQGGGPNPPIVLGDSITEDWEGCETGGYWTDPIAGNAWNWYFNDAGIWGDNLRHGKLACRLGKTSSSSITMAEDIEDGTSAIGFWAASYGNDSNATLRVDYSTDKGTSWNELGSYTFTGGSLQHIIMDIPMTGTVRFRIVQTSGTRANIDDITIYGRTQQEEQLEGDVNGDGEVNIADVNAVIYIILGFNSNDNPAADVNKDGEINIADVNRVIAIILGQ